MKRAVITAGPTLEAIDPVRFISNRSSGKQGYALAEALRDAGFEVVLVSGPTALAEPAGMSVIQVESAREMLAAVEQSLPADVFIAVAAVADWRPAEVFDKKMKGDKGAMKTLALTENPDILKTISQSAHNRPDLVVGFAAETHDVLEHARAKRARKGCDWIVANDVSGDVMGGSQNAAIVIQADQEIALARASKDEIAAQLAGLIAKALSA